MKQLQRLGCCTIILSIMKRLLFFKCCCTYTYAEQKKFKSYTVSKPEN